MKYLVLVLIGVVACWADNPLTGTWNCANVPDSGPQNSWTLTIHEDGDNLTGTLTNGEVEIPVSDIKAKDTSVSFRFTMSDSSYQFTGKVQQRTLDGRYSGEERGALRCEKP